MTEADWLQVVGMWIGTFTVGYCAGQIMRWFHAIGDKL